MASRDLQAVMDAAVDGVIIIDGGGLIAGINRSAERLFGYAESELLGQNVHVLMDEPYRSAHDGYLRRYAESGVPHIIGVGREVEARRRDGSSFPAFLSVGKVSDTDPPGFVGFVRDLTAEHQTLAALQTERDRARFNHAEEQEARRLQERLMQVSRMTTMGEMAAGVAHELNQPLSAIATYSRACQRFLDAGATDDPDFRSSLGEIEREAFRAGEIIRRLRQFLRSPAVERELTDLNELVLDVLPLVQADARAHQTSISTALSPEPVMAVVDRVQLQHVLVNLLRNAIEATTEMAGRGQVDITTRVANGEAELTVTDNGQGLAASMAGRLFMPFSTTKERGTGLGLVISRNIVEAHHGKLSYRPVTPGGASFVITMPLPEAAA